MNMKTLRANLLLVLTAALWGAAFVAQSTAMDAIGPFTFNGVRMLIGSLVLLPLIWVMNLLDRKKPEYKPMKKADWKLLITGGVLCGIALFFASTFQNYGIIYTTAGKAGFITTIYVVLVPILALVFLRQKSHWLTWIYAAIAMVGFYLLALGGGFGNINKGDLLVLVCAVLFAVHILIIDRYSPHVNGVALSSIQFFVCAILSLIAALITEDISFADITTAAVPILYAGICSCGIAYTLQIIAQKDTDPTVAALLMSLESVFSVLFGWLLLHERLTASEYAGCAVVFIAVVLSQIPPEKLKLKKNK
ncbi:MAG: DMT family transporter [Clostridia bacterium]|nr:DMT family transporter [Clostridia bacterium]